MLAYVFWHWRRADVPAPDYESRQRAFHEALAAEPISGFQRSLSFAPKVEPIPAAPNDGYEDWYLVDDFAALGVINHAAVTESRTVSHAAAASLAEGGTAGVYGLARGVVSTSPAYAHWFSKPNGLRYDALLEQLGPLVDAADGVLWMRQMTLGPAREFCLHAREVVPLPEVCAANVIALRPIWPLAGG